MYLSHLSRAEFVFNREWPYFQDPLRAKPRGLWLSTNPEWNWLEWTTMNDYYPEAYVHETLFTLAPTANILTIESMESAYEFQREWRQKETDKHVFSSWNVRIDWQKITENYDGISLPNYERNWDTRLGVWYDHWDLPSMCVWNLAIIDPKEEDASIISSTDHGRILSGGDS